MNSLHSSKPDLVKALGEHYDLTAFDYMTGKINPMLLKTKAGTNSSQAYPEGNKRKSTPNGNRYLPEDISIKSRQPLKR